MTEIEFNKYKIRGPSYHWVQVSKSIRKRNLFVVARYQLLDKLIGDEIYKKKVLDVGCGDGVLSYLLAEKGAVISGIDNSKEAIITASEKCKQFDNIKFIKSSVYELPFDEMSFDYVVSSDVIEHLRDPDKMLSEIKRVWNRRGKIIITSPIKYTEIPLDKMHYKEFFEEEFVKILEKYFDEIRIVKSHPLFWFELQNRQIFGRSFIKLVLNSLNLLFSFNPFMNVGGWRYYTLQTAEISR
jgi:2-polyprenyl-3-methyl-5-hydroxy-6-metoxy-1,4-benzoquinol methylase